MDRLCQPETTCDPQLRGERADRANGGTDFSGCDRPAGVLTSLLHPFQLPLHLVTTWRGQPGRKDDPLHETMGEITHELLALIGFVSETIPDSADAWRGVCAGNGPARAIGWRRSERIWESSLGSR